MTLRLQIISDLHGYLPKISKDTDLLIFAGDVATTPRKAKDIFEKVRKTTSARIIYVLGNHEFYDNCFPDSLHDYRIALKDIPKLSLLENKEISLGNDLVILGCTLWTDFDNQRSIAAALMGLNDFDFISVINARGAYRKVTPDDFIKAHARSRNWLENRLEVNKGLGKRVIVVTHHVPSFSLISEKYSGQALNGAFANNLDKLISEYGPDLWVYGHTHDFNDVNLGMTRCVCNPVGYTLERKNYKELYIVEV